MFEKACKKCGKIFIPSPQHIYRDEHGMYCSWHCYNHKDDGRRKRINPVAQYTKNKDLLQIFNSATQAAMFVGGTENSVRTACRERTLYKGYLWRYIK